MVGAWWGGGRGGRWEVGGDRSLDLLQFAYSVT